MSVRSILIVDDDDDLRTTLAEQLSLHEEFSVSQESNATRGINAARAGIVDLLIMDVGLPDMDGREAVKVLRKSGFKSPVIILTVLSLCTTLELFDFPPWKRMIDAHAIWHASTILIIGWWYRFYEADAKWLAGESDQSLVSRRSIPISVKAD